MIVSDSPEDHSCDVCGRGGFNDPDGYCVCPDDPPSSQAIFEAFKSANDGLHDQLVAMEARAVEAEQELGRHGNVAEALRCLWASFDVSADLSDRLNDLADVLDPGSNQGTGEDPLAGSGKADQEEQDGD